MKQKLLTTILCLSMAISGFAQDSGTAGNLTWVLDAAGTLTISGTGTMPDYVYTLGTNSSPWRYNRNIHLVIISEGVTNIGNYAFTNCYGLTTIVIPSSVTSIGESAFSFCESLTSITIPNSVTSIGEHAFGWCKSLNSITISNRVTSIEYATFYECHSLASVTIPSSVTSIGEDAFSFCTSLTSVTISDGVTSIGESAFSFCESLTSITIPNSVTHIGEWAFSSCESLTSITIPNSVTSIGQGAFSLCESLISVTIPESVTSIGGSAFLNCHALTSVTIPSSVTSIGNRAFGGCDALETLNYNAKDCNPEETDYAWIGGWENITTLIIGEGVERIPRYAFMDCQNLTSVTIPEGVTSIGRRAFSSCSSLALITIPSSVTSIGMYAFSSCKSLISVTIPESVTSIESELFRGCESLTSVTIPGGVTSIGYAAFDRCSSLTSVTIPEGITSIGEYAFHLSGLTTIFIPSSVTNIGQRAFRHCTDLEYVYVHSALPPTLSYAVFEGVDLSSCTLYVPAGSKESYKQSSSWREFNPIIEMQSVVIEDPNPAGNDGKGSFDFLLEIPGDMGVSGSLNLRFPEGYMLDEATTILSETLAEFFELVITLVGDNIWRIEIVSNGLRAGHDLPEYTRIMSIGYIVDESVSNGSYQIELTDIDMQLEDGTPIEQESITVTTEVLRTETGISSTAVNPVCVYSTNGSIVIENAPVGEMICVYNVSGVLVETQNIASLPQTTIAIPQGIYIVKVGSANFKVIRGK